MKVIAVIQARMSSKRLPGKVLLPFAGSTIIETIYKRLSNSSKLSNILVGTSNSKSDDILVSLLAKKGFNYYRGSLEDVMARFASICNHYKPDYVVRITGDCPLIDYTIMDKCIDEAVSEQYDYFALLEPYPDGLDVEIFKSSAITKINKMNLKKYQREHIGQYFLREKNNYKVGGIKLFEDKYNDYRLTIDRKEDYKFLLELEKRTKDIVEASAQDIFKVIKDDQDILSINNHIVRNEGLDYSKN